MTETSHVTDGIDLLVSPVDFGSSGVTTLVGGTVAAYAKSGAGTVYAANSCVVASATSVSAKWTGGTLPAGKYTVQVYATPSGFAIHTIKDVEIVVKAAAGP